MTDSKKKQANIIRYGYIISMGLLCLFIGVVIANYTKQQAEFEAIKQAPSRQLEQTVALLKESEEKKSNLEHQVRDLKKQIEKLQNSQESGIPEEQLKKIYQLAGLTEVKGKGIIVVLDDRGSSKIATTDNDGLVHSDDILKLVNELKSAGATAISVNNQRFVTTTEVVESGTSVMINQTRLVSPYEIKAIGDPEALKTGLNFRGSIIEYLKFYGIDIQIEQKEKLVIPHYTGKM